MIINLAYLKIQVEVFCHPYIPESCRLSANAFNNLSRIYFTLVHMMGGDSHEVTLDGI